MNKRTGNSKRKSTVNDLLGIWQVPIDSPISKIQIPMGMKNRKTTSVKKFLRETPIPRGSYPLLLTQDSFCVLFSITKETCAEWRRTYGIPYINLPHRIYFRVEDVQDFLDRHTVVKEVKDLRKSAD